MSEMMTGTLFGLATTQTAHASGTAIKLNPEALLTLMGRIKSPLVVTATAGLFGSKHRYLISYKGIQFLTESDSALTLPDDAEIVGVDSIPF